MPRSIPQKNYSALITKNNNYIKKSEEETCLSEPPADLPDRGSLASQTDAAAAPKDTSSGAAQIAKERASLTSSCSTSRPGLNTAAHWNNHDLPPLSAAGPPQIPRNPPASHHLPSPPSTAAAFHLLSGDQNRPKPGSAAAHAALGAPASAAPPRSSHAAARRSASAGNILPPQRPRLARDSGEIERTRDRGRETLGCGKREEIVLLCRFARGQARRGAGKQGTGLQPPSVAISKFY